ncbi:MAG: fibro-slime domain-containing protein [Cyanobacteria bacterium P01_A01_bin.135]
MAIELKGILRNFSAKPANFNSLSDQDRQKIDDNWSEIEARFRERGIELKSHPDFETFRGRNATKGIVESELGADRKPKYAHDGPVPGATTGPQNFEAWYNDDPGFNQAVPHTVTLEGPDANGVFTYRSNAFFPLNPAAIAEKRGRGEITQQLKDDLDFLFARQFFGSELKRFTDEHNYHFTFEVTGHNFTYKGTEKFTFEGDDDLWVFIDGKLVIDIGGSHVAIEETLDLTADESDRCTVNIANTNETFELVVGETYRFDLFHAERHTKNSNFRISTSLKVIPPPLVAILEATDSIAAETLPEEAPNPGEFRISLDRAPTETDGPIEVHFVLETASTATEGLDFSPLGRSVTFGVGERQKLVPVLPLLDEEREEIETVRVKLIKRAESTYEIGDKFRDEVIIKDRTVPKPTVSIRATKPFAKEPGPQSAGENGEFAVFLARDDDAPRTDLPITIDISGTATLDKDYQLNPPVNTTQRVVIPANKKRTVITVMPLQDRLQEGDETVVATLKPGEDYELGRDSDTVTITDTPLPVVTITATIPHAREGARGLPRINGEFTIAVDRALKQPLKINYEIVEGAPNSAAPNDYNHAFISRGVVTIPPQERRFKLPVVPRTDLRVEGPEVVTLALTPQDAYRIGEDNQAEVIIADVPLPTVNIKATKPTAIEPSARRPQGQSGEFTIAIDARDLVRQAPIPVRYAILRRDPNSATPGVDYKPLNGSNVTPHIAVIPAKSRKVTLPVVPLRDQEAGEGEETVTVQLLPQNRLYRLSTHNKDTVVICDRTPVPRASIRATKPQAREPGPGQRRLDGQFLLELDQRVPIETTVHYQIEEGPGSATPEVDYKRLTGNLSGNTGSITIPANRVSLPIPVIPRPDRDKGEADETVTVQLLPPPAAAAGSYQLDPDKEDTRATVTISDIPPLMVAIRATDPKANEPREGDRALPHEQGEFEIKLNRRTNERLEIYYGITGTATPGIEPLGDFDYELKRGGTTTGSKKNGNKVVIPPGANSVKLTVIPFRDYIFSTEDRRESVIATLEPDKGRDKRYQLHTNRRLRQDTVIIFADGDGDPTGGNG